MKIVKVPTMRENIISFGYAKKLVEALEAEPSGRDWPVTVEAPWAHLRLSYCRRNGARTGGAQLTVQWKNERRPWEYERLTVRVYLRASWTTKTLSRALFRILQAAPAEKPNVLRLYRQVEGMDPLPGDFYERVLACGSTSCILP